MPQLACQRLLGIVGSSPWLPILGFLVLPAAVVTIAAFNDTRDPVVSAARPGRCAGSPRRIDYEDFRDGFRNGLIVTAWAFDHRAGGRRRCSPSCSTAITFRFKAASKACCCRRW